MQTMMGQFIQRKILRKQLCMIEDIDTDDKTMFKSKVLKLIKTEGQL